MNAVNDLLDEAKEKNGYKSDNQLAIALGITRGAISHYRQNVAKPDAFTIARLSDFTGRPLAEILAMIEAEREKNKEKREYWKDFMKRIGEKAAALFIFVIVAANNEWVSGTLYIM